MAQISFDNGNTFYDPDEDFEEIAFAVNEKDGDGLTDEERQRWWEAIVSYMDDDVRERCHMESEAETNAEWLCDYLRMAEYDLVIG